MDQNQQEKKTGRLNEIEGRLQELETEAKTVGGEDKARIEQEIGKLQEERQSLASDVREAEGVAGDLGRML